ncbi:MAG TPA: cation-efflux pump [Candidatus Acidoferrales bacterium]|jgi:cation diffusion facilitator family transporter|nr:cation-efflux pump [Candidatus Acidoferrales bacterium]
MAILQNLEVREKKRAALLSVGSAVVLLSLKTFLVARTGSLGVLSEALHSGLDFLAAVITYFSVRMSDQPADEGHPYGHAKFENFSAFVETGLLLITAVFIIYEGIDRLFFHHVHIQPSVIAVLILLVALSIDITRAKALGHVARKYHSEAIEADALHFSTDVWSTIVVIAGIGLVWAGETWHLPWLVYADAIAGLAVAGVILWVGSQLGRRTLDALVDAAPEGLRQEIARAVARMEGVLDVDRVRVRRAGNRHFVDATVSVARTTSLEQVHALSDAIEKRIGEIVPSDVMVHAEPRAPQGEHLFESIRALAQRLGLAIHDVTALQQSGKLFIELHLEVDENLPLRDAHRQSTKLEEGIRALRDAPTEVNIHIEPLGTHIATPDAGLGEMKLLAGAIEQFLNSLPSEYDELLNCHDARVRQVEHRIFVSCHCTMKSDLPINKIHDVTAALVDRVKEKFPQIHRVTIHPEPFE